MNEHAPYSGSGEHDGVRPRAGSLSPYLLIVTALVAAFAAALAMYLVMRPGLLAAQAAADPTPTAPAATPSPSPTAQVEATQSPTPTPSPAPSPAAEWITVNATLRSPDDAWGLTEAPEAFRAMAAEYLALDYDDCGPQIDVFVVHPKGFVYGVEGYRHCGGGAHVVWAALDRHWVPAFAMQDYLPCDEFASAGLPTGTGVLGCYDENGDRYY